MVKSNKSNYISPAEEYAHAFQNPEPKYYTRIPNIIDHLTFTVIVNGKKTTKRLSVYAKEIYRIIRMVASDDGACWNNTRTLAKKLNCSVGTICKAKKELMSPMNELDGNSLILEQKKMITKRREEDGHPFKVTLCTYTVVDVWKWNNAFMTTLKYQKKYGEEIEEPIYHEADSNIESVDEADSNIESAYPGTDSLIEPNNNPCSKNPLLSKQQPTADAAPVCLQIKKKGKMSLSSLQEKAFDWMIKEGCEEKAAYSMVSNFNLEDIGNASKYVNEQWVKNKAKNKKIDNRWGYFRQTLKGRYWESE